MKGTIIFTREQLDQYIAECKKAMEQNQTHFIWKNTVADVVAAMNLINKLENSNNLSIPYESN